MLKAIKAMPVLPKILIGLLILVVIAKAVQRPHPRPVYSGSDPVRERESGWGTASGESSGESAGSGEAQASGSQETDQRQQMLAGYQSQQAQLQVRVKQCMADMQQASNQMAAAAMNGQMPGYGAPCQQYMPQWTAQEAFLETEIYRLQTGDTTSSMRQITGIAAPDYSSSSYPSSRASRSPSSDSGTDAVDNWDRQAIRGNSLYTDETGQERELPTRSYYFRDRASGEMIGSDSPYAPNNGRDYEVIQPNQPQY